MGLPSRTRTVVAVEAGLSRFAPTKWPFVLSQLVNCKYSSKCFSASAVGMSSIIFSAEIKHRNFISIPFQFAWPKLCRKGQRDANGGNSKAEPRISKQIRTRNSKKIAKI